jgi:hypothetical protein
MKNKNIAIALGSVLALIAAVGTTSPVFALSDSERHLVGFRDGAHQALADYGVTSPNPSCPTRDDGSDHTPSYCDGYTSGYRTQWIAIWKYHHPQQQSIDQHSNIRINGDNNRVVVNQQVSNLRVTEP